MTTHWNDATRTSSKTLLGNFSRFVDAPGLEDINGGVDFNNVFTSRNPFVFTTRGPVSFRTNREEPA